MDTIAGINSGFSTNLVDQAKISLASILLSYLQCFDTVSWAAKRHSTYKNPAIINHKLYFLWE